MGSALVEMETHGTIGPIHGVFTQSEHSDFGIGTVTQHAGGAMSDNKEQVRIEFTQEQRAAIKKATGKDAEAIELGITELEERIAPFCAGGQHFPS